MLVKDNDGNLWLEHAPFGYVPPTRNEIDANVTAFQQLSSTMMAIRYNDGSLWQVEGLSLC